MDWKKLLTDLTKAGFSQAEIAREIGVQPPSVNEILHSQDRKDVRWSTGSKILALHKRVIRKAA